LVTLICTLDQSGSCWAMASATQSVPTKLVVITLKHNPRMEVLLTEAPEFYHQCSGKDERRAFLFVKLWAVWKHVLFFFVLPAAIGGAVGIFALAFAMQNEPNLSAVVVATFSPGLKVAELLTPVKRESLGSTFGDFLRVAIAINGAFYFVIFAFLAAVAGRLAQRKDR
jgi:hypothetical protein